MHSLPQDDHDALPIGKNSRSATPKPTRQGNADPLQTTTSNVSTILKRCETLPNRTQTQLRTSVYPQTQRALAIEKEYLRKVDKAIKESKKSSEPLAEGVVVGVGLINREGSDKS
ncbi:hypothetical protein CC2G_013803 [Coprinopsis cinerea AmutBmut pab1-1]|nr:hypothetical protein CC2G_013803 [Coprinopsis cinerea AmutBmut pab1-1]